MKKKQVALFLDENEINDFEFIKKRLCRKTDSDTIRAMIIFCKKNFVKNGSIAPDAE